MNRLDMGMGIKIRLPDSVHRGRLIADSLVLIEIHRTAPVLLQQAHHLIVAVNMVVQEKSGLIRNQGEYKNKNDQSPELKIFVKNKRRATIIRWRSRTYFT
jgi:hypothetical protein